MLKGERKTRLYRLSKSRWSVQAFLQQPHCDKLLRGEKQWSHGQHALQKTKVGRKQQKSTFDYDCYIQRPVIQGVKFQQFP